MQGRKGLGTVEATRGPGLPRRSAHRPRILTPTPTQPTHTLSTEPLWGREALERIKGQMSKDQPLPRPGGEGGSEQLRAGA